MKYPRTLVAGLALGLIASSLGNGPQQRGMVPPAVTAKPAQKLKVEGLPNLGQVSPMLYRGGQPERAGYDQLKALGIEIVVNLRDEPDKIRAEKENVEGLGMRYASIPWNGWRGADDRQVAEFLELLRASPEKKVFVHCRRGAERTGVMVAAYRIAAENWTPEQALAEMEEFKFRGLLFRNLKKYIRELPERLRTAPQFRTVTP